MEKYSDKVILNGIRNRKDDVLEYLYRELFPHVKNTVARYGGDEQDARDIFQEALITIFKRISENKLVITSSFRSYFLAQCRFMWFHQNNIKLNYYSEEDIEEKNSSSPAVKNMLHDQDEDRLNQEYLASGYEKIYQKHYRKLPADCKKVIRMFYKKRAFSEIARKMNYATEDYARRKKYLCMQQLMKMIKQDPEYIRLKSKFKR